jgi:hypothetical protein
MNRRAFVTVLAFTALPAASAFAHDGHDHKLLGTVTALTAQQLVVRATKDGTVSTIALTATTKITRGKAKVAAGDLRVGDRVVVNIGNGKAPLTAKAVQAGPAPTTR